MNPAGEADFLRAEIRRTRADLGDTVAEIAARTNVRARVGQALADPAVRRRIAGIATAGGLIAVGLVTGKTIASRLRAQRSRRRPARQRSRRHPTAAAARRRR